MKNKVYSFHIPMNDIVNGVRGVINRNGDFYPGDVLRKAYEEAEKADKIVSISHSSEPLNISVKINKPEFLSFETGLN